MKRRGTKKLEWRQALRIAAQSQTGQRRGRLLWCMYVGVTTMRLRSCLLQMLADVDVDAHEKQLMGTEDAAPRTFIAMASVVPIREAEGSRCSDSEACRVRCFV